MSRLTLRVALYLLCVTPVGQGPLAVDLSQAETAFEQGDYTQATALYQALVAAQPEQLGLYDRLLTLQSLTEQGDRAALLDRALQAAAAIGDYAAVSEYAAQRVALAEALPAELEARYALAAQSDDQEALEQWGVLLDGALAKLDAGDAVAAQTDAAAALQLARDHFGPGHAYTVVSLREKALIEVALGHPEVAQQLLDAAWLAQRDAFGPDHPETVNLRALSADLLQQRGESVQAEALIREGLAGLTRSLGAAHPETLALRARLIELRLAAGANAEALALQGEQCTFTDQAYGALHPRSAECQRQLANLALDQGELSRAESAYGEALGRLSRLYPEGAEARLMAEAEEAELWRRQGQLAEAATRLQGILATPQLSEEVRFAAGNYLAQTLEGQGHYAEAQAQLEGLLAFAREQLGDAHPSTLTLLNNLAGVERLNDQPLLAERHYREVLDAYTRLHGAAHPLTLAVRNNLALLFENQGFYDLAEPLLDEGTELAEASQGALASTTLAYQNNLALLHESQGRFELAERGYLATLQRYIERYGEEHPETQVVRNNLAYLYLLDRRYEAAAQLMQRVLDGWTAQYGAEHPKRLKALNTLARVRHRQGQLVEAEVLFEEALSTRRRLFGEGHRDTIRSLIDQANLFLDQGRHDEALAQLQHTRELAEQNLGEEHPYTFEVLNALAGVLRGEARLTLEQTLFERRTRYFDRLLWVAGSDAREGYLRLHRGELDRYLDLLTQGDAARSARALLGVSLQRKGLLLKVAAETIQVARMSDDPALRSLTDGLNEARKGIAALTLAGPGDGDPAAHHAKVAALEAQIQRLEAQLGQASGRFRRTIASYGPEAVEAALPEGAALVDFQLYRDTDGQEQMLASVLDKGSGVPVYHRVLLGPMAALRGLVTEFRLLIQDVDATDDEVNELGYELYQVLWAPLEPLLGDGERVFLAPDDVLHILPFAALSDADGSYLLERYDLHMLTTPRDLLGKEMHVTGNDYLIIAGPDYDTEAVLGSDQLQEFRRSRSAKLQRGVRLASRGLRGLRFSSLPGAEREGRIIEQQASEQQRPSTIYLKLEAQEQVLRDMQRAPAVLHMATHGFFLAPDDGLKRRLLKAQRGLEEELPPPGDNPLLRSGLAFAGVNSNAPFLGEIDTDNDGVLTALEVLGLNLDGNKLAVLSACETGLGEIHEGEGVFGLRRSFLLSGSEAVVTSLWEVSDAGTQALMSTFYKHLLGGEDAHQALRNTQLELLGSDRWGYPYVWSSFMIVGI